MNSTWNLRALKRAILSIACALALTSCATSPSVPEPLPPPVSLPLAWPILPPPPDSLSLDDAETTVLVPLDYWLEIVEYIRRVDAIRRQLDEEGRIIK